MSRLPRFESLHQLIRYDIAYFKHMLCIGRSEYSGENRSGSFSYEAPSLGPTVLANHSNAGQLLDRIQHDQRQDVSNKNPDFVQKLPLRFPGIL